MTPVRTAFLVALAAATATPLSPASADARSSRHHHRHPVVVRPWAHPPTWYGPWGAGFAATALHGRALRTTAYPYGPKGSGVRAYWYPQLIYGYGWGTGWRPCC